MGQRDSDHSHVHIATWSWIRETTSSNILKRVGVVMGLGACILFHGREG